MKQIKTNKFNPNTDQVKMPWTVYDNYNIQKDPRVTIGKPINEFLNLINTGKTMWY